MANVQLLTWISFEAIKSMINLLKILQLYKWSDAHQSLGVSISAVTAVSKTSSDTPCTHYGKSVRGEPLWFSINTHTHT